MLVNRNRNIIYFDSDAEFYDYCVIPEIIISDYIDIHGEKAYSQDFNFTPQYNKAVANGMQFIIKDEDSQIYKHGGVNYRCITKPVSNLEQYIKW